MGLILVVCVHVLHNVCNKLQWALTHTCKLENKLCQSVQIVCSNFRKTSYTCRKFLHFRKSRKIFTKMVIQYPPSFWLLGPGKAAAYKSQTLYDWMETGISTPAYVPYTYIIISLHTYIIILSSHYTHLILIILKTRSPPYTYMYVGTCTCYLQL